MEENQKFCPKMLNSKLKVLPETPKLKSKDEIIEYLNLYPGFQLVFVIGFACDIGA